MRGCCSLGSPSTKGPLANGVHPWQSPWRDPVEGMISLKHDTGSRPDLSCHISIYPSRVFFSPPPALSLNLSRPHLHGPPSVDSHEHRQLLKFGRVARVVLVQLHNFLIGTLVLVLAEISIFFFFFFNLNLFFSSSSKCVERAFFTRPFFLSLSFFSSHPLFPSLSVSLTIPSFPFSG